ncbi:hypothetical protein CHS0354_026050 [Potamilus streckersoni]|uniref:Uncharacterized protein n=1 Tax=Potamilus streckersoni TaxID=2493646 RepID=A0AAE0SFJ5_9BIVA|nr:hypothetical protein CHS0354_026050 [Potamilus streckersoni]
MPGSLVISHTMYDRITNMEQIKRILVIVAVLAISWSSCKSDEKIKKKIQIRHFCCRNHNLMCKDKKTDEKELMLCFHTELVSAQYAWNKTFCEVPPGEETTIHSTSETDYAGQEPSMRKKDHDFEDRTYGVSVPVVILIAILMFLLGIVGMLIFTCFTYELWKRWKICGPFHSCFSHDTYIDNPPNKLHTVVTEADTNKNKNNPTYHDPKMANHSVESCVYDNPRDSIQADHICNPEYSVGTQETTNRVIEKQDGNKTSTFINPSQYELLNKSENQNDREHRYSCIQSEPHNLDSSELTSGSASASTHSMEYSKGNHVYFEVEAHSKVTTSGS